MPTEARKRHQRGQQTGRRSRCRFCRSAASRAAPQSYVLSGAADPPVTQQARAMVFGLLCAAIGGIKLARSLSWLQFRWSTAAWHAPRRRAPCCRRASALASPPPPFRPPCILILRSCVIIVSSIVMAACLALICTRPEAYRRRRLHLWTHPLVHFVSLLAVVRLGGRC